MIYHILNWVEWKMNPQVRRYAAITAMAASFACFAKSDVLVGPDRAAPAVNSAAGRIPGMQGNWQKIDAKSGIEQIHAPPAQVGEIGGKTDPRKAIDMLGYFLIALGAVSAWLQYRHTRNKKKGDADKSTRTGEQPNPRTGGLSLGSFLLGATSSFAHMKYRMMQGYLPGIGNNAAWLIYETIMGVMKIKGDRKAAELEKNAQHEKYSKHLQGMRAGARAFRPRLAGMLMEAALSPMLAFDRMKGRIIEKTGADWNLLVAKTMAPAVLLVGAFVMADPLGIIANAGKEAVMKALATAGGIIVLGAVASQSILSMVLKDVRDINTASAALGLFGGLCWTAINIHFGEPAMIILNSLWLALRSPVYYFKAKEVFGKNETE